jgi:hypothetical protein
MGVAVRYIRGIFSALRDSSTFISDDSIKRQSSYLLRLRNFHLILSGDGFGCTPYISKCIDPIFLSRNFQPFQ